MPYGSKFERARASSQKRNQLLSYSSPLFQKDITAPVLLTIQCSKRERWKLFFFFSRLVSARARADQSPNNNKKTTRSVWSIQREDREKAGRKKKNQESDPNCR